MIFEQDLQGHLSKPGTDEECQDNQLISTPKGDLWNYSVLSHNFKTVNYGDSKQFGGYCPWVGGRYGRYPPRGA